MATIKDIAKAANVSVATVSNVLNGKTNVGEEKRQEILQLCKDMNYQPNIMARGLKAGRTDTVLFSFSDFERHFYLKIIHGINDCLLSHGMGMIICTHTAVANILQCGLVDGAIVLDKSLEEKQILAAAQKGIKIVTMDRYLDAPGISNVVTDNGASMEQLVTGLIKQGYKHFHFVGGLAHTLDHMERYQTFIKILKENQISFGPENYFQGDYTFKSGLRAGNLIAMGKKLPEAVVCANDSMAAGVVRALNNADIIVPENVVVSGFDGDPIGEVPKGYLTTAVIPRYEMGYLAAETLVNMVRSQAAPVVQKIKAPVHWGESTRRRERD